jgi:hypothetical protein
MATPEAIRTQILDLVRQYQQAKFAHKTFDPDKDGPLGLRLCHDP